MATESEALQSLGALRVVPPPGITASGKLHEFQDKTVARLRARAAGLAGELNEGLSALIEDTYTEGEGTLLATTQATVVPIGESGNEGVEVRVTTGANHVVFLTSLAGYPFTSSGHVISAHNPRGKLRFFWKNPWGGGGAGVYSFQSVFWRQHNIQPGADPIAEYASAFADRFARDMLDEHQRALVEFVNQNQQLEGSYTGLSERVFGG